MPLRPGTRLGSYQIVGTLGAGGMGEVYRAKDLRLGREVAVKVLPAEVSSNPDRLARFEREARTVAGLNHPNIVTLHSVEDEDGVRFLTMELVEGQTLSDLIVPGGLPLSRVLDLSIALTDALVAAHERGVTHRDLKPANVMLTREGRLKVLDFGLAKLASDDEVSEEAATIAAPISNAGLVLGTVPYMAPEQLRGEAVDARTDLFALGILIYEMATGNRPFSAANPADTSSAILRDAATPLTKMRADFPADFERITSRCLEKNPRERIQSALDVNNELRRMRKAIERSETAALAPVSMATVAVLPFVNRSANPDDEYFSEGLADQLINVLAKIKGLRVSARTSSFHFKGKDVDLNEIGKALKVATILEGSVRKAGNRLRVSVQLVKVEDGFHLWSETYDRTLDDIFAVQDDIAHSVVKELRSALLGEAADSDASGEARAEVAQAAKGRAVNPEAHRLFLLARHLADRRSKEDTLKALQSVMEALVLDPEFALAWTELARINSTQAELGWMPVEEALVRAREAVEKALSLEPDLADAHAALAQIRMVHDWDWSGAREALDRALELEPGNARILLRAGLLASNLNRLEEAIGLYHRATELDPLRPAAWSNLGFGLYLAGRFSESEAALLKAQLLAPGNSGVCSLLALALAAQGKTEEALAEVDRETFEPFALFALAIIYGEMGRRVESDVALQDLLDRYADTCGSQIATIYAARGDADAAFEWLERAYEQRDSGLIEIKPRPEFRPFHADPRWRAFMKKMGFEE